MHKTLSVAVVAVILAALLAACRPPPPPPPPQQQQPSDYFQPASWRADNQADADLGSSGPVFVDAAKTQLFQVGKQHTAFLLDTSSLGSVDHNTPLATLPNACGDGVFGQNAVLGSSVYIACRTGVRQVVITPGSPPTMSIGWSASGAIGPVAADPASNLIWSANHATNSLYGLSSTTGVPAVQHAVTFDSSEHFPTPAVVGSDVLIESGTHVVAFSTSTSATLPLWTSPALDGIVQSRPVVVGNVVVVATENGSLYGLSLATGLAVWSKVSIGVAEPLSDVHSFGANCGDIDPLGITSNVVVDNGVVYAVGERNASPNPPQHVLIGVNAANGLVTVGPSPIDPPGSYNVAAEQQRAGLAAGNGKVYVGFGGLAGDCGDYHGFVVAASETTGGVVGSFEVAAATKGGAVWATSGIVLDGSGNVYASTGNDLSLPSTETDFSDAVIKLPPNVG